MDHLDPVKAWVNPSSLGPQPGFLKPPMNAQSVHPGLCILTMPKLLHLSDPQILDVLKFWALFLLPWQTEVLCLGSVFLHLGLKNGLREKATDNVGSHRELPHLSLNDCISVLVIIQCLNELLIYYPVLQLFITGG